MADADVQLADMQHVIAEGGEPLDCPAVDSGPAEPIEGAVEGAVEGGVEGRLRRIYDHRLEAENNPNALMACLAGVNSDLIEMELHVGNALRQSIAGSGLTLDDIDKHAGPLDLLIRLAKQISVVAQLELRSVPRESGALPKKAK